MLGRVWSGLFGRNRGTTPPPPPPVGFDSAGAGNTATNSGTVSAAHTCAAGSNRLLVGVAVGFQAPVNEPVAGWTRTATFNGVPMTSRAAVDSASNGTGWLEVFELIDPPTVTQHNVVVNVSAPGKSAPHSLIVASLSYSGVISASVVTANCDPSHAPSVSVNSDANSYVAGFLASGSAISGPTDTQRFLQNLDLLTSAGNLLVEDQVGAAPSILGAAQNNDYWAIIVVNLAAGAQNLLPTITSITPNPGHPGPVIITGRNFGSPPSDIPTITNISPNPAPAGPVTITGTNFGTPAPTPVSGGLRIPSNVRIRGMNHVPWDAGYVPADNGAFWSSHWRLQPDYWDSWWKPQYDDIKLAGGNGVRQSGCMNVVSGGAISLATYLSRWQRVLDYTASLGLYIYPTPGCVYDWGPCTWTQAENIYGQLGTLYGQYDHVCGVDTSNELPGQMWNVFNIPIAACYSQPENPVDLMVHLAGVLRSAMGHGIPVNHSPGGTMNSGEWLPTTAMGGQWANLPNGQLDITPLLYDSDMIERHVYYNDITVQQASIPYSQPYAVRNGVPKHQIWGEYGITNATILGSCATVQGGDARMDGSMLWCAWPCGQDNPTWGLYTWSTYPQLPGNTPRVNKFPNQFLAIPATR